MEDLDQNWNVDTNLKQMLQKKQIREHMRVLCVQNVQFPKKE